MSMHSKDLLDHIKGVLARENVGIADARVEGEEVIVFIQEGKYDPSLVVQLVERHTKGDYQGEVDDEEDSVHLGLRFLSPDP